MDESASRARRYEIVPERSALLVAARSNVGPIEFGMAGLTGYMEVEVEHGVIGVESGPRAHVEVRVSELRSGKQLYDAELLRRIDARRFPVATIDLSSAERTEGSDRYQLEGQISLHGVERSISGSVSASLISENKLAFEGEQVFDIRDFQIPMPKVLMLRIYPDVKVQIHVEAEHGQDGPGANEDSQDARSRPGNR